MSRIVRGLFAGLALFLASAAAEAAPCAVMPYTFAGQTTIFRDQVDADFGCAMLNGAAGAVLPDSTRNLGLVYTVRPGDSIQAMLTAAGSNGGGTVYVQKATYTLGTPLLMSSNTTLWCEPGATLFANPAGWTGFFGALKNINFGDLHNQAEPLTDHDMTVIGCTFTTTGSFAAAGSSYNTIQFRKAQHLHVLRNKFIQGGDATAMIADDDTHVEGNSAGIVTTGSTHTTATLDGLVSTQDVTQGMVVFGPGIQAGTTVSAINSVSSVTLSLPATATAAGVQIIFGAMANACWDHWEGTSNFFVRDNKCGSSLYGALATGTDTYNTASLIAANGTITGNKIYLSGTNTQAGIWLNGLGGVSGTANAQVGGNTIIGDGTSNFSCVRVSGAGVDNKVDHTICRNTGTNSAGLLSNADTGGTPSHTVFSGSLLDGVHVQAGNIAPLILGGAGDAAYDNRIIGGTYPSCAWLAAVNNIALGTACDLGTGTKYNLTGATNPIVLDADPTLPGLNMVAGSLYQGGVGVAVKDLSNVTEPAARSYLLPGATTALYYATDAKGAASGALCTWDGASGHDVGDCINGAYAAAAAAGGGTVYVPCNTSGVWYVATAIVNHTSGIGLQVCTGPQVTRDVVAPGNVLGTRLVWNGTPGATMFDNEPATAGSPNLYRNDISAIFDCNATAAICAKISSTVNSTLRIAVAEPRSIGLWMTTNTIAGGNQGNDIWLYPRCTATSDAYHPTCVLFDGGIGGVNPNFSYDRIHDIVGFVNSGDGVVFGYSDTVHIDMIRMFDAPGLTIWGHRFLLANGNYTMPNGVLVHGVAGFPGNIQVKQDGAGMNALGMITGSSFANGTHAGTATYTPFNVTVSGAVSAGSGQIVVTDGTGIIQGDDIDCGVSSGVNHYVVNSVLSNTLGLIPSVQNRGVANSTACVIGLRPTFSAVAGTYTLTYNGATYDLTAPAGGHTQTGISVINGHLSFTDILIPWAGAPVNGDTWTISLPTPSLNFYDIYDSGNGVVAPAAEPGATGYADSENRTRPTLYGAGGIAFCVLNWGGGPCATATGPLSFAVGPGNSATQNFGVALGQNSKSTAFGAVALGVNNTADGIFAQARGDFATARGHWGADAFASGEFTTQGDAQTRNFVLRGSGAVSGGAVRLTADGLAAGSANCINIPNNTAYHVKLHVIALDHATPANNLAWDLPLGLLSRGANAAATAWSAGTPVSLTNGTVTGWAVTPAADTTNGCLDLTFTHPTTTNLWNVVARVETAEVQ